MYLCLCRYLSVILYFFVTKLFAGNKRFLIPDSWLMGHCFQMKLSGVKICFELFTISMWKRFIAKKITVTQECDYPAMGPQMTSLLDITWQFQTSWLQKNPINVAQVENAVKNENIRWSTSSFYSLLELQITITLNHSFGRYFPK